MVKMTCNIRLGLYRQKILIEGRHTKGKTPVEAYWLPMQEIPKFIAEQSDVTKVFLMGPEEYTHNIENKYQEIISNNTKYTKNKQFTYWQNA